MISVLRVLVFCLLTALLVTASPALPQGGLAATRTTNAALFARGLAPKRPARLFNPSRPRALSPRQSPAPAPTVLTTMRVSRFPDASVPTRRATNGTALAARQAAEYVQIDRHNGNIYVDGTPATFVLPASPPAGITDVQVTFSDTNWEGVYTTYFANCGAYYTRPALGVPFGSLRFGMFNVVDNYPGSFMTTMWTAPTPGAAVQIAWTDAQGSVVPIALNFYVDSTDGNRLTAAQSASNVNAALTEDDRVYLTRGNAGITAS